MKVLEAHEVAPKPKKLAGKEPSGWFVFLYAPAALFSLKASRATSTAGLTLLTPTPYAVKMAFLDVALRHDLTADAEGLVKWLAKAQVRIGLPEHACVTSTIQTIRQETRDADLKKDPSLPPYRPNVALREVVHYQGTLRFAFERSTCSKELQELLLKAAPAINYLGKRGGFLQYLTKQEMPDLDGSFTQPAGEMTDAPTWCHRASLDDFGPKASFDALNSYTPTEMKRGVHRRFVETIVPLGVRNRGPGFAHYTVGPASIL